MLEKWLITLYRLRDRILVWRFRHDARLSVGKNTILRGKPIIDVFPGSTITIGVGVVLCSRPRDTALGTTRPVVIRTMFAESSVSIGDDVGISGAAICAARSVSIGSRVLLGSEVLITDTDFHPINPEGRRRAPVPHPRNEDAVVIEDDVFVGARAIVLKGIRIGRGSVVGAGSVVTRDIPPMSIVAGNPARVIGQVSGV